MKRSPTALVEYLDSDSDESSIKVVQPSKKRKLPSLPSSLVVPVPIDNPALHQGRVRTTPHVEGQFAAHAYVSLSLSRRSQFYKTIHDILCDAREVVPSLQDIWPAETTQLKLHISLSRPIFLRAHQREEFKRAVKNIANSQQSFQVSFTTLSELKNDEETRTFLTVDIGAGFPELRDLCEGLSPALRAIHAHQYYTDPKFHASIGWALLHQARQTKLPNDLLDLSASGDTTTSSLASANTDHEGNSNQEYATISCLPSEMIASLNRKYSDKLASLKDGTFLVEAVALKIGKQSFSWKLSSSGRRSQE